MERIFYNKKTSILFVTAMLVLILLVCMLLVTLTQMVSMTQRVEQLNALIAAAKEDVSKKEELLKYMETDEYVINWAIQHDRLSDDDISWIKENVTNK